MPATEQTWRDQKLLHKVFAVSCVILLIATMWMFAADHSREWKPYQSKANDIELRVTDWRKVQFETNEFRDKHAELQTALRRARGMAFPAQAVAAFRQEMERRGGYTERQLTRIDLNAKSIQDAADEAAKANAVAGSRTRDHEGALRVANDAKLAVAKAQEDLAKAAKSGKPDQIKAAQAKVEQLQKEAERLEGEAEVALRTARAAQKDAATAELKVARLRDRMLVSVLEPIIKRARFLEDTALLDRKFKSADLDKAKADLGLGVRDGVDKLVENELQARIEKLARERAALTLEYEATATHRQNLQDAVKEMTKEEDKARKDLDDSLSDLRRLETTELSRRSNYFEFMWGFIPLPGKKWLEMPILDAFNSPRKIDNLWSEGLTQEVGSFGQVRRFDRCTTCHQAIQKAMPGSAVEPAYEGQRLVEVALVAPTAEEFAELGAVEAGSLKDETKLDERLEEVFGLRLADEGLVSRSDVTVKFIRKGSRGANAAPLTAHTEPVPGKQLREAVLFPHNPKFEKTDQLSGLVIGDVVAAIDGDMIGDKRRAALRLLDAAGSGDVIMLTVRRGLPHPYASHPRLDLFVGSLSPHKMSDFACTVCHDGQGSATSFKWASHSPDNPEQRRDWANEHGWFDNPHWIYPMQPKRFAESSCLKCHHEVVELEPSEKFPDAPAPKLMHGYNLIRKYGCYGCHEINGYDGGERIGPDIRVEPNFYAAALQLKGAAGTGYEKLTDEEKGWVERVAAEPSDDEARHRLYQRITEDAGLAADQQRFNDYVHQKLGPVLKDVESPGAERKPGPSLRYLASKVDQPFLFDWLLNPQHFRPSTRMPRFFGLHGHLSEKGKAVAEEYEPVEIFSIGAYLLGRSQQFSYIQPADVSPAADEQPEDVIARGKQLFEERGCLACHNHKDFPDTGKFRADDEIVQGPDLSGIGDKFDPQRNPNGPKWLYTWIREPNRYHARTVMPDVKLEPIAHRDKDGNVTHTTDPAADIVAYLLKASRVGWKADPQAFSQLDEKRRATLDDVTKEHLLDAFYVVRAQEYLDSGIPARVTQELKGAEKELIVADAARKLLASAAAKRAKQESLTAEERQAVADFEQQKLAYVGRKSIAKWGCYGCHDVPGFEDAKPIGTGLADWGRKETSKLAFEHIVQFIEHQEEGHGAGHGAGHGGGHSAEAGEEPVKEHGAEPGTEHAGEEHAEEHAAEEHAAHDELPEYYHHQLESGHRAGFIYQKLRAPRSYDYHKTVNKKYNERLRMPKFAFDHGEREAVITFVLGLVADPPSKKYIYQPNDRQKALIAGRKVLEKFNCAGCHLLDVDKWKLAFKPDRFGEQTTTPTYDFVKPHFTPQQLADSAEPDRRGLRTAVVEGLVAIAKDGLPQVTDEDGLELDGDDKFRPKDVDYFFQLWRPTTLDGHVYQVGDNSIPLRAAQVEKRYPFQGGFLARYLVGPVTGRYLKEKGSEAFGWLPPPLTGEGEKVQSAWLHDFLMDPYPIRPATVLRMPKFTISAADATKLVDYFAAKDGGEQYVPRDRAGELAAADAAYGRLVDPANPASGRRFDDAMKIVTNSNYCIQCHIVGDFEPKGADQAKAPDLAEVYRRLKPGYLRKWIAKPTSLLPYTAMPVNVKLDPSKPQGTSVPQELYHGTAEQQIDGLVDLLMNYDRYASEKSLVAPLVEQNKSPPPAGESAAGGN